MTSRFVGFVVLLSVVGCSDPPPQFDASKISTEWALVRNITEEKPQFRASITLINNGDTELPAGNWQLYFSLRYHGYQLTSQSTEIDLKHVSGDLFYLAPTNNFLGLKAGQSVTMDYTGNKRIANFQDVPSGLFWVDGRDSTQAIRLENPTVAPDKSMEQLPAPDAAGIYHKNEMVKDVPVAQLPRVFPTPIKVTEGVGTFNLSESTLIIASEEYRDEATYLMGELEKVLGHRLKIDYSNGSDTGIQLRRATLPAENYHLNISPKKILIEAGDKAGIFYGIQSLKILLPPNVWRAPATTIPLTGINVTDGPRFPFRAFMLDVARNFQSKEQILKTLEIMSLYKLNVFHFHLTDDEGWRLEIPGIPELTSVGATRGYPFSDNKQVHPSYGSGPAHQLSGTGYYTTEDYIEIVRFANARHIRIVPEIESPGHARAAIKAMAYRHDQYLKNGDAQEANRYLLHDTADQSAYMSNQYFRDNVMNMALPSTYVFIEKVVDELISMHQNAGAPLTAIHMAGDEVPFGSWEKSPAVEAFRQSHPELKSGKDLWAYYFEEIKKILRKRNLAVFGWQELVVGTQTEDDSKHVVRGEFVSNDLQVDAWWNMNGNEDVPYQLANAGYNTVLTCFDHFYFDLAYAPSFQEPGDAWIGFLDVDRIFSFIPYDYYRNFKTDVRGNLHPANFFDDKDKLDVKARSKIVGIQGALWGENMVSSDLMEYMLVPRLLALAERAWSKDPSWAVEVNSSRSDQLFRNAWSQFANTLGKRELPRLDYYPGKIKYRIPTPGAIIKSGNVVANIQLPGFVIRYTNDGSEPNEASTLYQGPITEKKVIRLKAFDQRGRGSLPLTIVNK